MSEKVGFIGLGAMGRPMAARLLAHGYAVVSCVNVNRAAAEALEPDGLLEAPSAKEVALGARWVITIVRNRDETEAALRGPAGVLAGLEAGTTLIIMSTLEPDYCRQLADELGTRGVEVLDVPVSGFPWKAAEGTLALMAGGDKSSLERSRPLLEVMGRVHHCGGVGMGMVAKLANNAVAVGTIRLVAEALEFASRHGLGEVETLEILSHASGDSFIVRNWSAVQSMLDHVMPLGHKDLQICLEAAAAKAVELPLIEATSRYPGFS